MDAYDISLPGAAQPIRTDNQPPPPPMVVDRTPLAPSRYGERYDEPTDEPYDRFDA